MDHGEPIEGDKNKAKDGTWETTWKSKKSIQGKTLEKKHSSGLDKSMLVKKSQDRRI